MNLQKFISELRRRNVVKVATAYAIVGWLIIQVIVAITGPLNLPEWVPAFFIILVAVGFPIALIIAWAFELTPEGLRKTTHVQQKESIAPQTGKRINRIIIGSLSVLVVFLLIERIFFAGTTDINARPAATLEAALTEKSIAVLPFDDFNAGGDEEYFADGLTEEILNALAKTPDLMVASRTSSFRFKDRNIDARMIADTLGVAHILEGSVRKSTGKIRITAQLIRASDGFHLWSETYDENNEDIIDIQEDIAVKIATALETIMDPMDLEAMLKSGTQSVDAYQAYLNGNAASTNNENLKAKSFYEEAIAKDPEFAAAYERIAIFYLFQLTPVTMGYGLMDLTYAEKLNLFNENIDLAILYAADTDRTLYQARKSFVNMDFRRALEQLEDYFSVRQNNRFALSLAVQISCFLGDQALIDKYMKLKRENALENADEYGSLVADYFWSRKYDEGAAFVREALKKFPYDNLLIYQSHRLMLWAGEYEEASRILAKLTTKHLSPASLSIARIRHLCIDNKIAEAEKIYDEALSIPSFLTGQRWISLMWMGKKEQANELLFELDNNHELFSLSTWLHYPYFDITLYPNIYERMQREGITLFEVYDMPRKNPL